MERIRTTEIGKYVGRRVRLTGWMHNLRTLGRINFLLVRDGYGIAQAVTHDERVLSRLGGSQSETVLEVEGTVVEEAQAPHGLELHDIEVRIITPVDQVLPFPINKPSVGASLDILLDHSPVTLRHPRERAQFRVAAEITAAFREFLDSEGFTEIHSPKLVASATESGANVFAVDYFGAKAFLAQSPQFYKQIMVGVFERVYEVGPVFRAEPHDTSRHVNEYVSLDAECGFIQDHRTVMALLNRLLGHIVERLSRRRSEDLALLQANLPVVPPSIPAIDYRDAQNLILERYGEDCRGEPDLASQHERWLCDWAREELASDFLFVPGFPMAKRPFYTHPDPQNPAFSNSFDLLFRGMEIVTGGQRLHRYADYIAALEHAHLPHGPFEYYLEAMKYGMPPHGGFAIGLERLTAQLLGLANIREATLFPRDIHRLAP